MTRSEISVTCLVDELKFKQERLLLQMQDQIVSKVTQGVIIFTGYCVGLGRS